MRTLPRSILHPLFVPGGLVFATALLAAALGATVPSALATYGPPAVAAAGILVGWRFGRARSALAMLMLFLAGRSLHLFSEGPVAQFAELAAGNLLPLNLGFLAVAAEGRLLSRRGRLWLAALVVQVAACAWLWYDRGPETTAWLLRLGEGFPVQARFGVPPSIAVSHLVAVALVGARYLLRAAAVEAGFLWAVGASFAGFVSGRSPQGDLFFLAGQVALLAGLMESFHRLAFRDELTGLPSRRALNEMLAGAGSRYALALVDIDHFKRVNDRHGHDVGDQVLRMVAGRLTRVGRGGRAYRYGGEEFALHFPNRHAADVRPALEELRLAVAAAPFTVRRRPLGPGKPRALKVTVSVGVAERNGSLAAPEAVIKAADKALYRAKRGGRNRICP